MQTGSNATPSESEAFSVLDYGPVRLLWVRGSPIPKPASIADAVAQPGIEAPGWRPASLRGASLGRGGACVISWAGGTAFYRPLRRGGALAALLGDRFASMKRLAREMRDAVSLAESGVPVASPLLGRAERIGVRWELALISEALDGVSLAEALDVEPRGDAEERAPSERRALLRAAGRVVARMHALGFRHPDLHPGNLFVETTDAGPPRIAVLDLTGGRWTRASAARVDLGSLVRCARWWHKHRHGVPHVRDALAFLQGYTKERETRARLLVNGHAQLLRQLKRRGRKP